MAGPARKPPRYADYLELEQRSLLKHEWLDGEIVAMAGGTPVHAELSARVTVLLGGQLLGSSCRPYSSDLRLRVPATGLSSYPDVAVVCGPLQVDAQDPHAATNPVAVVEVLSPSTEGWDRGDKFDHLRHVDSLADYVLISQHRRRIEHYARQADGTWLLAVAGAGQGIRLTGCPANLEVDLLYEGVVLSDAAPRPDC
ncbi:MAG: Uma2 family endonuclease [Oligoflexia bacterium]|nr:Uma2 family endonuclease [Oligoflexia bacterium]